MVEGWIAFDAQTDSWFSDCPYPASLCGIRPIGSHGEKRLDRHVICGIGSGNSRGLSQTHTAFNSFG